MCSVFSLITRVLIECKDTTFGANDLSVLAMKAMQLSADKVIIITTRDVHQNVLDAIPEMTRGLDARSFEVISQPSASEIRKELDAYLDRLATEYVQSWLEPNKSGMSWARALYDLRTDGPDDS